MTDADLRHRVVEILERELARDGCQTAGATARRIVACIEGAQIVFEHDRPPNPQPWNDGARHAEPSAEYQAAREALRNRPLTPAEQKRNRQHLANSLGKAPWQS